MITDIVFNEIEDKQRVYYRIAEYDTRLNVIRIEHVKAKDIPDGAEAVDLNDIRKEHISIVYYSKYNEEERD